METTTISQDVESRTRILADQLNAIEARKHAARFQTVPDVVTVKVRKRFIALDVGTSGAWLVDRASGEIYNIKAYGVPDNNKKAKADIGNVFTVDPERMHGLRWNYLR